jgi:hypothetical protein
MKQSQNVHQLRTPAITPVLTIKGKSKKLLREGLPTREFKNLKLDANFLALLLGLLNEQITVKNQNRRITVSADMYVEDDETFGSNETVRRQKTNAAILSVQGLAQSVMDFEVRMGGEIRVEFTVTASLLDANGNAIVDGEVKLYEGTSESTGDLDGVRQFQLYIPAGATINHFVRVNNDDEGGDYATIRLNITNVVA